jgi:hypothetical protein
MFIALILESFVVFSLFEEFQLLRLAEKLSLPAVFLEFEGL